MCFRPFGKTDKLPSSYSQIKEEELEVCHPFEWTAGTARPWLVPKWWPKMRQMNKQKNRQHLTVFCVGFFRVKDGDIGFRVNQKENHLGLNASVVVSLAGTSLRTPLSSRCVLLWRHQGAFFSRFVFVRLG